MPSFKATRVRTGPTLSSIARMKLADLHRSFVIRGGVLFLLYTILLLTSWWLAHELRFDFADSRRISQTPSLAIVSGSSS